MELKRLQTPFPVKDIEWRVGAMNADKTNGLALPYVTNRAIQDRLDQVIGPENWRNEFERWNNKGVKCGIAIKTGEDWVTKYDGADETNIEPTKGGFSDSMKRAAVQWGIGRYLYDLPAKWINLENGRIGAGAQAELKRNYQKDVSERFQLALG